MLKLTYTEHGLQLERVAISLEDLIGQRVVLAVRTGQRLHIEPGQASFLLRADAPGLTQLQRMVRMEQTFMVTITPLDDGFVEVTVRGSWIAETIAAHEGIFITALSDMSEFLLMRLWKATQSQMSFLA